MANELDKELERLTHIAKAAKGYTDDEIGKLDAAKVGSEDTVLLNITEVNGVIAATSEDKAKTITGNTNRVTTETAVKTYVDTNLSNAIAALDVASVGADGKYIKLISETDGKIAATAQSFDTALTSDSEVNAPTTHAAKLYIDNAIGSLDAVASSTAAKTLTNITETNGVVSTTFTDIEIAESQVTGLTTDIARLDGRIDNLDNTIEVLPSQTIATITQTNGKVEATPQAITIAQSQVTGLTDRISTIENKISTTASDTNKLVDAQQLTTTIGGLDFGAVTIAPSETLSTISETNGIISAAKQVIQIGMDQVTDLAATFTAITNKIPAEATTNNKLADKAYVKEQIETYAATSLGSVTLEDLGLEAGATQNEIIAKLNTKYATAEINDYVYVAYTSATGAREYQRYAKNATGSTGIFVFQYKFDNLTFTTEQKAALNSGINATIVADIQTKSNMAKAVGAGSDAVYPSTNAVKLYVDDAIKTAQSSHDADITKLQTNIDAVDSKVNANTAAIAKKLDIKDKYDDTAIVSRIATLETDNTNNKADIVTNTTAITNLQAADVTINENLAKKVDAVSGKDLVELTKIVTYDAHLTNTDNPHSVTKAQVGLGNVDNTSDLSKPISTATQNALDLKVDKVSGSALLANTDKQTYDAAAAKAHEHTNKAILDLITKDSFLSAAQVTKLNGIEEGAQKNVKADWSITDSDSDAYIKNKPFTEVTQEITSTSTSTQVPSAQAVYNLYNQLVKVLVDAGVLKAAE